MTAIYKIQSRIHKGQKHNYSYKSIDAVIPQIINAMREWLFDFEICSISENRDCLIMQIYYDDSNKKDVCSFMSVTTLHFSEHYDVIAVEGVL